MPTLDAWLHFLETPRTIACPRMVLHARDTEPPLVEGKGEIRIRAPGHFEFSLTGKPADEDRANRLLRRQKVNSYDGLMRFRLRVVDEAGLNLSGGYTIPDVKVTSDAWIFTGECEGLLTDVEGQPVSPNGSTELIYIVPQHWARQVLVRELRPSAGMCGPILEGAVAVLDTELEFAFMPEHGRLSIRVPASKKFPLTYTEWWISEPLRILFGQLASPRLIARNKPDGTSMIFVCQGRHWTRNSDWIALWQEWGPNSDEFLPLFTQLLSYIAQERDVRGLPNVEGNKLTKVYEEVIQASRGSRWISALTLASSIEALVRILSPKGSRRHDADDQAIDGLIDQIKRLDGDERLKNIAKDAVMRTKEASPRYVLRRLLSDGILRKDEVEAWEELRNQVMHGHLVSPYSNEEEDQKLLALARLMGRLTKQVIRHEAR